MSNSNGIISSPVRQLADIKAVLGESVNGLGALCTSNKVNMWSKNKPVRHSTKDPITDTQRSNVLYGFNLNEKYSASSLMSYAVNVGAGNLAWGYNKPRGHSYSEYFRRRDFDGYQHNAGCPAKYGPSASAVYAVDPHPTLISLTGTLPATGNITLADLGLSESDLKIAYRAGTSGTLNTASISLGGSIPFGGGGYTYQYATFYQPSSSRFIPTAYPYFELTVAALYGIDFQGVVDWATTSGCQFHCMVTNLGRGRTLNVVSFHARKSGHYSQNSDGYTYTITANASGVASDYEQDITVGVQADYSANPTAVNMGNESLQRMYNYTVDPYSVGNFFVRVQYIIEGRIYKDIYLNMPMRLPVNP